jgi:hypothetical protein
MKIFVSPYRKVEPGTGYISLILGGQRVTFSKDQIRELYYAVLGIQMPGTCLDEEFQRTLTCLPKHLSVDVPEDAVKCEIVIENMRERG